MTLPRLWAVSDLHVRHRENRAIVEGLRPRSADDWLIVAGDVGRAGRRRGVGAGPAARAVRRACCGCPATTSCGRAPRTASPLRGEARYRHLVETCPRPGRGHPGGPVPGVGRAGRSGRRRAALPALRLHVPPRRGAARPRRGWPRRTRRAWSAPTSSCCTPTRTRRGPPGARRGWPRPGAARRARSRPAHRAGQPLAAHPAAHARAAAPGVLDLVRHDGDRRLARALPRGGRRLRAPAHPAGDRRGRGAVRRGVAGLPAGVAGPRARFGTPSARCSRARSSQRPAADRLAVPRPAART